MYRRGRAGVALLALLVGAGMAAAMLSVYYDANQKMTRELRAYGANVMAAHKEQGGLIDEAVLAQLRPAQSQAEIVGAAPYLYAVVSAKPFGKNSRAVSLVIAGTKFDEVKKASPWWQVAGDWIDDPIDQSGCLVGANAARELGVLQGQSILVSSDGDGATVPSAAPPKETTFAVRGIVTTGSEEDDQIFAPLAAVQALAAHPGRLTAIAISVV